MERSSWLGAVNTIPSAPPQHKERLDIHPTTRKHNSGCDPAVSSWMFKKPAGTRQRLHSNSVGLHQPLSGLPPSVVVVPAYRPTTTALPSDSCMNKPNVSAQHQIQGLKTQGYGHFVLTNTCNNLVFTRSFVAGCYQPAASNSSLLNKTTTFVLG